MVQYHRLFGTLLSVLFFFISANAQLEADFTYSDSTGCGTLQVEFCDISTVGGGATIVSRIWDLGGAPGGSNTCANRVFGTPGTYTICLTITDDLGNTDTACKDDKIQIFNLPSPEFSANPTTDCAPSVVTFTDMSTSTDGVIEEWLWGLGGSCGTISQNAPQTPAAICTYSVPDDYTVSLTIKDNNGCENTMTKSDFIHVAEQPAVSIAASSTFGCESPFTVSFLNTSSVTTGLDFEWSFGNGDTFSGEEPDPITYTTDGTYTVEIIATDPLTGCGDTLTLNDYITVGYPVAFQASETEGCVGTSVTFTDNSLNVADGGVIWDFGDGSAVSTEANPTHIYSTTGCHFVKLTRTVGGCITEQYMPQCINIVSSPSFNTNNDNSTGCSLPHVVNFSSISSDAESWEWVFGDNSATSTAQNPTHSYTNFGDYDVYIIGTNAQGCSDSTFVTTISVVPVEAILSDDNIEGCAPLEVTLSDNSTSITNIVSWKWELAAPSGTFISFSESPTYTLVDIGCIDVTLTVTNTLGCSDTRVFTDAICIGDNPVLNFSATPLETCIEQPVDFLDLSDNTVDYWYWDFGDGNDAEEQNPTHYYQDTGYYDVNLIAASNGCFTSITFDEYVHVSAPVAKYNVIKFCDENFKRKFKNNAVGADSIFWDFGTGLPTDTSTIESPEFVYPASGTYTVTQTVFNFATGCSHSRSEEIEVTNPISNFAPSITTGCSPLTLTLNDNSLDAEYYYWSSPDGIFSDANSSDPTITFDDAGSYTGVQLIIKDINNCRDTFVMTETIFANEITADIVADPIEGCVPLEVNFTDNSNNLYNTNNTWSWDFGDGNGISNEENPTYTFTEGGDYSVMVTVTDSWGCTDEVEIATPIFVGAPIAFFEASEVVGCTDGPISFSNISDGEALSYFWDFGDSETSTDEYPEHTYATEGVFTVCLTVTDQNSCDNTLCYDDYISISTPAAAFTQDVNFASCPPLTVNFQNQSTGAVSYLWDFGDLSGVSTLENPSHVYTVPGSYEVTLIATNAGGCTNTIVFDDLVVLDGPEGSFTMDIDSSCAPAVVTLIGESIANYTYTWDSGNGIVQTSFGSVSNDTIVFTYNNPGLFTPTLSLENATGCFRTLPEIGDIHVSEMNADFGASATLICDNNEPIDFFNFSSSPDGITSSQWIFESGNPATVNGIEAQTVFPGLGSYDVTLIADNGICRDTITKTDYINIGPSPVADFSADIISGCEPLTVSFTDLSSVSAGVIDSWLWNFSDGTTDTGQNPTHIFAAGDDIEVVLEVTTAEGCTQTFTQLIDVYAASELTISDDLGICIGETAQLEVQIAGDTIGSTFGWSPAAGLTCVDCLNPIANPADTTTYTFTMTNAFGCTSSVEVTVDVKPSALPVIQLTADTSVCLNSGIQLIADAGAGTFTYDWDVSNPGLDCIDCPNPLASPIIATTYTVTVTNEFGCSSSESVTVNVIDDSQAFMGDDKVICDGASVELDASFGNNPVWLTTDGLDCTNCPNPIATPSTPTQYVVQITTDNGCVITDSIYVDLFYSQDFDAGIDQTICGGETTMLSGYGLGSVVWSPVADLDNPNIINPMASPSETTTYYMTLTNGDCVITDSLVVEITESTEIEAEDFTICEGESIELGVFGNADQFEWISNATLSAFDIANPIANPIDSTSYTVIASLGACLPDTAIVNVNVIPGVDIDILESANFFPGQGIPVNVEVAGNGVYGYMWSPSVNVSCSTCLDPTISPASDSLTYYIQVTNFETGCITVDSIYFNQMNTCPPELIGVPNIFSPNGDGNNDKLEVFLANNMVQEGIVAFKIYDRWGAQVFQANDANDSWDGTYKGQLLDNGVYLFYIEYVCPIDGSIQIKKGNVTLVR